ncbi:MAG TPA: hypothetical protein VN408_38165 [Actinoplanes sp.]|nr:hypothetical protein [Actinoplanes sp.]
MATGTDDVVVRFGRWAIAKLWFGVLVSGAWAVGQHYHWSQAFLTVAAVLGAVGLALASSFLPVWTRQRPSGIPVADVGLRVMVWGGLIVGVIALLVGAPMVGMPTAALLLTTAARTFGDPFGPLLRRLRITPAVRYVPRTVAPPRRTASSRPAADPRPATKVRSTAKTHHTPAPYAAAAHPSAPLRHPRPASGTRPAATTADPRAAASSALV